jgi:hypothetical protein
MPKFQHHLKSFTCCPGWTSQSSLIFAYGVWEFGEFGTEYLGARWDPRAVDNLWISIMEFGSLGSLGV